jgi:hypothetical protein
MWCARGSLAPSWRDIARSIRMPSWLPSRCSCMTLALRAAALPVLASRSWGRTSAAPLLCSHDMGERRAETVWDSIALHTTASIAQHKGTDAACCQSGIACDYGGVGYQQLSDDDKGVILSAYPRLHMKQMLTTCLCGIAKNHPNTTRNNFIADFGLKYVPGYTRISSVDFLHQAPFAKQAMRNVKKSLGIVDGLPRMVNETSEKTCTLR